MCGILGAISKREVASILLDGLQHLEYRGYDSSGMVTIDSNQFYRYRAVGKVSELGKLLQLKPLPGHIGIAHTRWATHGKPSECNAHPHIAGNEIALVHNGIIENHENLRSQLLAAQCELTSETDSELAAHLVYLHIQSGHDLLNAVLLAAAELEGTYSFGFIRRSEPLHIIALCRGSPLVIGLGRQENFVASDSTALLSVADRFIYLEDGDVADIHYDRVKIHDMRGEPVKRPIILPTIKQEMISKAGYPHFMLKEIFEQPEAILSTLESCLSSEKILPEAFGVNAPEIFKQIERVQFVACGTSFHAALVGKYWLEAIAKIPCRAEIASEYRYRPQIVEPKTLFVVLSQSGETADTLAALRMAKDAGYVATLGICNVPSSSIVRECDLVLLTKAGVEIGVASTKAFTAQLTALFILTLILGAERGVKPELIRSWIQLLRELPGKCQDALSLDAVIKKEATNLATKENALFLGRGSQFFIAMEGALKLKEISYLHAEACPAGELKHGPIALIDNEMSIIMLAPADELITKLKSNLEEILARSGKLLIFADKKSNIQNSTQVRVIEMPEIDKYLAPIIYAIPMQLLAYHVAVIRGTDVDQPRNLAKSVTVE